MLRRLLGILQKLGLIVTPTDILFPFATETEVETQEFGNSLGYDTIATLDSLNWYVLNGAGPYSTKIATINFVTLLDNQSVTLHIKASSQQNTDFMCCGNLDSEDITTSALKVSGLEENSFVYNVPSAGNHYVKVYYRKDGDVDTNEDKGYYRLDPFVKKVIAYSNPIDSIKVESGVSWEVTQAPIWLNLSLDSGNNGTSTIEVSANLNNGETREGDIVIKDATNSISAVHITLTASPLIIKASESSFYVNDKANTTNFKVNLVGNDSFTVECPQNNSWVSVDKLSGTNNDTVTLTWQDNTQGARDTFITLRGNKANQETVYLHLAPPFCPSECLSFQTCLSVCLSNYSNICKSKSICSTDATNNCTKYNACPSNRTYTCSCNNYTVCSSKGYDSCASYTVCSSKGYDSCSSLTWCGSKGYDSCGSKNICDCNSLCSCNTKVNCSTNCSSVNSCNTKVNCSTNCSSVNSCGTKTTCSINCASRSICARHCFSDLPDYVGCESECIKHCTSDNPNPCKECADEKCNTVGGCKPNCSDEKCNTVGGCKPNCSDSTCSCDNICRPDCGDSYCSCDGSVCNRDCGDSYCSCDGSVCNRDCGDASCSCNGSVCQNNCGDSPCSCNNVCKCNNDKCSTDYTNKCNNDVICTTDGCACNGDNICKCNNFLEIK